MKVMPTLLIALVLAAAWPLHAADHSLLSESKSDYQIVLPDSLETPAPSTFLMPVLPIVSLAV